MSGWPRCIWDAMHENGGGDWFWALAEDREEEEENAALDSQDKFIAEKLAHIGSEVGRVSLRSELHSWSDEPAQVSRALLEEMYVTDKLSIDTIAYRMGTNPYRVKKMLKAHGLAHPPNNKIPRPAECTAERLRELYKVDGLTIPDLSRRFGISRARIYEYMKEAGIKSRKTGEKFKAQKRRTKE